MKTCVFPGTFDPFTNGHLDIIERASKLFDKVIVAVSASSEKGCMYDLESRVSFARAAVSMYPSIEVEGFNGLLVDFMAKKDCKWIIRGLRTVADLEYEDALSTVYRIQNSELESVFLLNNAKHAHVHGTFVRDLIRHGGDVAAFVPPQVLKLL